MPYWVLQHQVVCYRSFSYRFHAVLSRKFLQFQPTCYHSFSYRCHAGLDPASRTAVVNFFKSPCLYGYYQSFCCLFSTFCLDAKSGAKKSRQTRTLRAFCRANAQQPLCICCVIYLLLLKKYKSSQTQLFQKAILGFYNKVKNITALYPALLFYSTIIH